MRNSLSATLVLALVSVLGTVDVAARSSSNRSLATISGIVRDSKGTPLSGALVSLLKEGAGTLVKQTRSAADGTFSTKILPGRYDLRAVAAGFNEVVFTAVQIKSSEELVYKFNLEPAGSGKTLPERRKDHDNQRWVLSSAHGRRSIFQAQEGEDSAIAGIQQDDSDQTVDQNDEVAMIPAPIDGPAGVHPQGVIEAYTASSANAFAPRYSGVNFAYNMPASGNLDVILVGQAGTGTGAPQRIEATARFRPMTSHTVSVTAGAMRLDALSPGGENATRSLGQVSMRAIDEWVVRDGIVVVMGLDYSRFVGLGNAGSVTPRFGLQFDANAKTRVRAAYTPGEDLLNAENLEAFEGAPVSFKLTGGTPIAIVDGKGVMERSRRLEFGVERVLDNESSLEATAFFDTTSGRGVGILSAPATAFGSEGGSSLISVANQQGQASGMRVVYSRRINRIIDASAGYAVGEGQKLSSAGITNPASIFSSGFFQSAAVQLNANLNSGTHVRTVFRFSPAATVFAIDPFAGRLAVYDPSLSIVIAQDLPTFGLPIRASALIDARNLLDTQACAEDGETALSIFSPRRSIRGGIAVRF